MPAASPIDSKLKELPDSPGVYQLKDKRGRVIYIGKALSLKNRVVTYFQSGARYDPRIAQLVKRIADLDWIVVPTELDALIAYLQRLGTDIRTDLPAAAPEAGGGTP